MTHGIPAPPQSSLWVSAGCTASLPTVRPLAAGEAGQRDRQILPPGSLATPAGTLHHCQSNLGPAGLLTNRSVLSRLQPCLDKGVLIRGVALPRCSELGIWGCAGAPCKSSSAPYFVQVSLTRPQPEGRTAVRLGQLLLTGDGRACTKACAAGEAQTAIPHH